MKLAGLFKKIKDFIMVTIIKRKEKKVEAPKPEPKMEAPKAEKPKAKKK